MDFATFYESLYGYMPFPWQARLAAMLADGCPPDSIAAPTASGKTSVIDAWVWALAYAPGLVSRRLWYVVQRRILVDDAHARAVRIAEALPRDPRAKLAELSATGEPLRALRLRGGVFDDMAAFDPSVPMVVCSTADQHMSRLLFRGYGVVDMSLPVHAALAGSNATIVIDEAHLIPTYDTNLRRCVELGADLRVISMTATPTTAAPNVLRLDTADRDHAALAPRLGKCKPAQLLNGKPSKLAQQAKAMIKADCRAVIVFCNTVQNAVDVQRGIPGAWLLTGRIRDYDRQRLLKTLDPLHSGKSGPEKPTVVVATQTLEVGADLDFDGLVTECASLAALRQRFGRLNRLGQRDKVRAAIVWDGKKQTPVYGECAANVFNWLQTLGDQPDLSTVGIERALQEHPPEVLLDEEPELGPPVTSPLIDTWCQTCPRPLWDVPVADYIDPSDDTNVTLVWRDEPTEPTLVEAYPPHPQEAAPVPIMAVRNWADQRQGVRWRGPDTAVVCRASELRPGDVWVLEAGADDGRRELGCVLDDSPADVADVPGERLRARGELLDALADGEPLAKIAELSGIAKPIVTRRGDGYVVSVRRRGLSLSSSGEPIGLAEHNQAVANLAREMAERLGLDAHLLQAAGAVHDVGKADARMQVWMGADAGELLAKSGQPSNSMRQLRPVDLPSGWRHEMLSTRMLPTNAAPELVHLVGTHHGRCRPTPPAFAGDGWAAIELGGQHLGAQDDDEAILESAAIARFAAMGNPWQVAHLECVLVMADRLASRDEATAPPLPIQLPTVMIEPPTVAFHASALDGCTLLGWMAAVGALRVLSEDRRTWLQWESDNHAILLGWTLDQAVQYLVKRLQVAPPVCRPDTWEEFQGMGLWGPAVGKWNGKEFKQSPLMGTGAAGTGFSKAWPKLAARITADILRAALAGPWEYYDGLGQRWDTAEHAEHGSQWGDPSREGSKSVHGANRLAIESLPLMPTIADGFTIGWDSPRRAATWPLWRGPLDLRGVCVALRQPMRERWMSRKIAIGQFASFLPAEPVRALRCR